LMADGSGKPIKDVVVGDHIANAAPGSPRLQQHQVDELHVTDGDTDFDDLDIGTSAGSARITTTAHHLFWDVTTQSWTEAADLKLGEQLNTPGNGHVAVVANYRHAGTLRTYNLTVDSVHTYYVLAGNTPVLVHNDSCESFNRLYGGAGVMADLKDGVMTMIIEKGVETTPGEQMFTDVMNHFGPENVSSFDETWIPKLPANLNAFNRNLRNGMSLEDAARNTFTGKQLAKYGLTNVTVDKSLLVGNPGNYVKAEPVFSRPAG
jgi:hypothetical protein